MLPTGFRGRSISLNVLPSDSIGAVKDKIQALEGIPHQNQRLICADRELIHGRLPDCHDFWFVGGAGLNVRDMHTGRTITLDVQPSDTIDAVKAKIQDLGGIPIEEQSLIFAGKRMEGSLRIEDCNLQNDNTFYLMREKCPRSGLGSSILLHVKMSTGRTITLDVQPPDYIDQFSSDVSIAAGIPDDELVLSVAGRRLENGRRFDYYNFQSDENIYLYQRVRAIEGNAGSYELPTILLHVATSAGHTYSFALLPTSTVGDVMRKIQTLEDIPPHEQRLVHYGQVLDSGCTLAHYCVQSFSSLALVEES